MEIAIRVIQTRRLDCITLADILTETIYMTRILYIRHSAGEHGIGIDNICKITSLFRARQNIMKNSNIDKYVEYGIVDSTFVNRMNTIPGPAQYNII